MPSYSTIRADGTVHIWNAIDGNNTFIYTGHKGAVRAVIWSPDNDTKLVSASADSTVQIWHPIANASTYTYRGHSAAVNAIAWTGSNFIASGSDDKTVQIWDSLWEAP